MNIADLLERPPVAPTELAQRAGISRNTEWSLRRDQSRARLDTLREIALACGYDVEVVLRRAYDPVAVAAARDLLDDLEVGELLAVQSDLLGRHPDWAALDDWRDRLRRYSASTVDPDSGGGRDAGEESTGPPPLSLVVEAAAFAGAQNAPDAILLAGRNDLDRLMSAATAASAEFAAAADTDERFGHRWAFSGWPALEALGARPRQDALLGGPPVAEQRLPTIVWTTQPELFGRLLVPTHRRVGTLRAATVIVSPLAAHHLAGVGDLEGAPLVSPVQAVIDSVGVGGDLGAAGFDLAMGW